MKKYIIGFLTGIIASVGVVGVFAATQEYSLSAYSLPVYINGVKYPTDALPVLSLNLNGGDNTYVPLRNFSDMMGASVDYNKEANRIDITTNQQTTDNSTNSNINSNTGNSNITTPVSLIGLEKSYNDSYRLNTYNINGVDYVVSDQIDDVYFEDRYKIGNDEYEFEDRDRRNVSTIDLEYNDRVVINDIPVLATNDDDDYLITLDYFVNNIYPTIK